MYQMEQRLKTYCIWKTRIEIVCYFFAVCLRTSPCTAVLAVTVPQWWTSGHLYMGNTQHSWKGWLFCASFNGEAELLAHSRLPRLCIRLLRNSLTLSCVWLFRLMFSMFYTGRRSWRVCCGARRAVPHLCVYFANALFKELVQTAAGAYLKWDAVFSPQTEDAGGAGPSSNVSSLIGL